MKETQQKRSPESPRTRRSASRPPSAAGEHSPLTAGTSILQRFSGDLSRSPRHRRRFGNPRERDATSVTATGGGGGGGGATTGAQSRDTTQGGGRHGATLAELLVSPSCAETRWGSR